MRNLLNFLIHYSTWFVFLFYVLLSCILLFSHNTFQQSIYLSSANIVASKIFGAATNVTDYFNLRTINASLQERNAQLENEVFNLQNEINGYRTILNDTNALTFSRRFNYVSASVLNNSLRRPRNYFTIDKGASDGVKTGMGVVDQNGVVGIVNVTSPHTARIISLLNETQHFSVKIKDTPFVGSLSWKGGDPATAYVEEIPRHVRYTIGDTIVTSGFSTTFPEGIPVGTVMARVRSADDNFFVLKVRLTSDFTTLSTVRVLQDALKAELDSLTQFDLRIDE
ncbi:MAG: rod shape-determining protein MreC [Muribaculaceae bacterium]|nr:rod shape-determining protein MreC [Muribaculaceae bacterium]